MEKIKNIENHDWRDLGYIEPGLERRLSRLPKTYFERGQGGSHNEENVFLVPEIKKILDEAKVETTITEERVVRTAVFPWEMKDVLVGGVFKKLKIGDLTIETTDPNNIEVRNDDPIALKLKMKEMKASGRVGKVKIDKEGVGFEAVLELSYGDIPFTVEKTKIEGLGALGTGANLTLKKKMNDFVGEGGLETMLNNKLGEALGHQVNDTKFSWFDKGIVFRWEEVKKETVNGVEVWKCSEELKKDWEKLLNGEYGTGYISDSKEDEKKQAQILKSTGIEDKMKRDLEGLVMEHGGFMTDGKFDVNLYLDAIFLEGKIKAHTGGSLMKRIGYRPAKILKEVFWKLVADGKESGEEGRIDGEENMTQYFRYDSERIPFGVPHIDAFISAGMENKHDAQKHAIKHWETLTRRGFSEGVWGPYLKRLKEVINGLEPEKDFEGAKKKIVDALKDFDADPGVAEKHGELVVMVLIMEKQSPTNRIARLLKMAVLPNVS